MRPDGSARCTLTDNPGVDAQPCWSPDGKRLCYASLQKERWSVRIIDAGGGSPAVVTADGAEPAWSPDGRWIAFSRTGADGNSDLYMAHPDGSGEVRLTTAASYEGHPSWSPDSRCLAYQSNCAGSSDIWRATVQASGLTDAVQLTNSLAQETSPAWSPDGKQIAFETDAGAVPGDPLRDRNVDICVMAPDGTGYTQLTSAPEAEVFPAWSPDSAQIAFGVVSKIGGEPDLAIFAMDRDGSGQHRLSPKDRHFDYSPVAWAAP